MPYLAVAVHDQDHIQGPDNAPLTLVEYGDFQCPSCGQAHVLLKHVQDHFGQRLRLVFRHYPLEQHPMAEPAAEASEFAASQGKFWQMHDALFAHQAELSTDLLVALAGELRLNETALERSVDRGEFGERIQADLDSGDESGVAGTPTFFINGKRHEGSFSAPVLVKALEAASA